MKKISVIIFSSLLTIAGVHDASAHAQLTSSNPAKNQIVNTLPPIVWLEFDGNLMILGDKQVNRISVTNSKNVVVSMGEALVGGARISSKLKPGLPPGKYSVAYRIVSEDGHPVQGTYSFTYKPK
jgi:methionine-rich copper-binding protein CopC